MAEPEEDKSKAVVNVGSDLFGLSEASTTFIQGALVEINQFLRRICYPAAEELGLLLSDQMRAWRTRNYQRIVQTAEQKLAENHESAQVHAHPRLVQQSFENGSWIDDNEVQDWWGGLLASSCTEDGKDDSNLIFMNLLSQLTSGEAKMLKFAVEESEKFVVPAGWVDAHRLWVPAEKLFEVSGITEFHRLDRELDHLRALDLLSEGGFSEDHTLALIDPSPLSIHLYVRCQGSRKSPREFFGLQFPSPEETPG